MNVLIVDDSALLRSILKEICNFDEECTIVAEATNGKQAVELNEKHDVDLIIMDVNMPVMDGLEATEIIMKQKPVPILIFSNEINSITSFHAISKGAVEVMSKPDISKFNDPEFYTEFFATLKELASAQVTAGSSAASVSIHKTSNRINYKMVVMGASTGGPVAVRTVLSELPADFPVGIALVQHLEDGFDKGYVEWLDEACKLSVRLAGEKDKPGPGEVVVAPVGKHLVCNGKSLAHDDGPRVINQKPSVDVLFESAAKCHRGDLLGVLLTGMGRDGARGCKTILDQGGFTIVQDEHSSAIFGMPKAAIDMGGASIVLPLHEIAAYMVELLQGKDT